MGTELGSDFRPALDPFAAIVLTTALMPPFAAIGPWLSAFIARSGSAAHPLSCTFTLDLLAAIALTTASMPLF